MGEGIQEQRRGALGELGFERGEPSLGVHLARLGRDGAQRGLADGGLLMTEHLGDALRDTGLAGERARKLTHGGDLRGGGRGLREPLAKDRREDCIGVRRLDQGEISILGECGVSRIRLTERELENIAVVRLLGPGLRGDAQETGLRNGSFDGSEIGGGETGETHARGEDGVLEHQVSLTGQEAADGRGDGGRLRLAESQAFETATDYGLIGRRKLGEKFGIRFHRRRRERTMSLGDGHMGGLPFGGAAHAVDRAGDVGHALQAGRAMRIPGAGVDDEQRAVRGFDDVGKMRALAVYGQEFVLGRLVGGALRLEFETHDLLGVVVSDEEVEVIRARRKRMVGGRDPVTALPEGAAAGNDVTEFLENRHTLVGAREIGDDAQEIRALVDAAELPVHEGVDARAAEIEVDGAHDLAGGGEVDAGRIVGAA